MKVPTTARRGFTLVELIVGMAILLLMFGFLLVASDQMTKVLGSTTSKSEQFRSSRDAFERMTSRLSQATLNTYWGYDNDKAPTRYQRVSELRFVSDQADKLVGSRPGNRLSHAVFFNAPLGLVDNTNYRGLENLLNTWGWFVEYGNDQDNRPKFIGTEVPVKWRWRLMEFSPPSENFLLYRYTNGMNGSGVPNSTTYTGLDWVKSNNYSTTSYRPLVDNVIALVITPRLAKAEEVKLGATGDASPLAPDYSYDSTKPNANPSLNSKNQLPPVVQVTMVAIDEKSAEKLNLTSTDWNLFGVSNKFKQSADYTKDLSLESPDPNALERRLVAKRVGYRVFTTDVHIRAAKWSREQTN